MSLPPVFEKSTPAQMSVLLRVVQKNPLLNGRLVEGVALTTTASRVKHGLGRTPLGFLVVGINANAVVYENSVRDSEVLNLRSSASVTVDLWVF